MVLMSMWTIASTVSYIKSEPIGALFGNQLPENNEAKTRSTLRGNPLSRLLVSV